MVRHEEGRPLKRRGETWRKRWIAKFTDRQRISRRWISLVDLADWCAQSSTCDNSCAEQKARDEFHNRFIKSLLSGAFELRGKSQILYLDSHVSGDGWSPRCRLTTQQFKIAIGAAAGRPEPGVPLSLMECCWLPNAIARCWVDAHGYREAPHFVSAHERRSAHGIQEFDVRLGWIPFGKALKIIGRGALEEVKKAIQREALRAGCRADGIWRNLKPHWLDFAALTHSDEIQDVLWFDQEKVSRARTRDPSLEPVPDRASEIMLSLAQCRGLWPKCDWPEGDVTASATHPRPVHASAHPTTTSTEDRPQAQGLFMPTGAPGRPSKGMHFVRSEFDQRRHDNKCKQSLREEATELEHWFRARYPMAQPVKLKTIENNIRGDYRAWKARQPDTNK
jgi:hypothetical protein